MELGPILLISSLFFLVGIGSAIVIVKALPFVQDKIHESRVAYLSFLSKEVGTWFILKLETRDLFAAYNPINVSIHTSACNPEIRSIQLEFVGASSYFPRDYNFSDPSFFPEQFEALRKSLESNIVILERNTLTTFAGSKQNLTYTTGGEFDIGITVTYQDGRVVGYGVGNTDFVLKNAIRVSPPEVLVQLRNGRITTGLTWAAAGLTFIAIGITGLIEVIIKFLL